VAIPKLRTHVSVPVIGVIEPGAQAAVATTRNRHIGVIGTRATIRSGAYENALRALNVHVRVSSQACPLFVPLIEEGLLKVALTDSADNFLDVAKEALQLQICDLEVRSVL